MQNIWLFFLQSTHGYDLKADIYTTFPIWPNTHRVFVEYLIAMGACLVQDTQMVPVIYKNNDNKWYAKMWCTNISRTICKL